MTAVSALAAQTDEDQPDCVRNKLPWLGCFFFTEKVPASAAKPNFLSLEEFIALNPVLEGAGLETKIPSMQVLKYMEGSDLASHNIVILQGPLEHWEILDIPVEITWGSATGVERFCSSAATVPTHIRFFVRNPFFAERVYAINK